MGSHNNWDRFLKRTEPYLGELVQASIAKKCVAYIGAGASKPCGFPLWSELLAELIVKSAAFLDAKPPCSSTSSEQSPLDALYKLKDEDPILCAELVTAIIGPDRVQSFIQQKFLSLQNPSGADVALPSRIHLELTRIPFRFLLTSNYDNLLEQAHKGALPKYTYKQIADIQRALKSGQRSIVKIHGDVDDANSIVLTASQYRDLQFTALAFQHLLETLFLTHSILFLGTRLTDPDVLHLLNRMVAKYGDAFGPHYALVRQADLPPNAEAFYEKNYRIHLLPYEHAKPPFDLKRWSGDSMPEPFDEVWVSLALQEIGGRVAAERASHSGRIALGDPIFNAKDALQTTLNRAVNVTGSLRGDVCMTSGRDQGDLGFYVQTGVEPVFSKNGYPVPPISVVGSAFHRFASSEEFLYARNVGRTDLVTSPASPFARETVVALDSNYISSASGSADYKEVFYLMGNSEVRSELAVLMIANGRRTGVLNLEARQTAAYNRGYIKAASVFARQAAIICETAYDRQSNIPLCSFLKAPVQFLNDILLVHPILRRIFTIGNDNSPAHCVDGLLYQPDYFAGSLNPLRCRQIDFNVPSMWSANPDFLFSGCSFAAEVFRRRRMLLVKDSHVAAEKGKVSAVGLKEFQIEGPLLGMPIFVDDVLTAVFVLWSSGIDSRKAPTSDADKARCAEGLVSHAETIRRMAQLFANAPADRLRPEAVLRQLLDTNRGRALVNTPRAVVNGTSPYEYFWDKQGGDSTRTIPVKTCWTTEDLSKCLTAVAKCSQSAAAHSGEPEDRLEIGPALEEVLRLLSSTRRLRYWYCEQTSEANATFHLTPANAVSKLGGFEVPYCGPIEHEIKKKERVESSKLKYFQYVFFRYRSDPQALVQDHTLFGLEPKDDVQPWNRLSREQWITVPIVDLFLNQEELQCDAPSGIATSTRGCWSEIEGVCEPSWSKTELLGMLAGDAGWRNLLLMDRGEPSGVGSEISNENLLHMAGLISPESNEKRVEDDTGQRVLLIDKRYLRFEMCFLNVLADVIAQTQKRPDQRPVGELGLPKSTAIGLSATR